MIRPTLYLALVQHLPVDCDSGTVTQVEQEHLPVPTLSTLLWRRVRSPERALANMMAGGPGAGLRTAMLLPSSELGAAGWVNGRGAGGDHWMAMVQSRLPLAEKAVATTLGGPRQLVLEEAIGNHGPSQRVPILLPSPLPSPATQFLSLNKREWS